MFNTTRQDQTFTVPANVPAAAQAGRPDHAQHLRVRARPRWPARARTRRPAARSTSGEHPGHDHDRRRDHADRLHRDRPRPGAGTDARLEVTGAVSATIAYIGALTGTLNLNIYAGADGQDRRLGPLLPRALDAGSIPGVSLTGQVLLEINTFGGRADDRDVQDQEARGRRRRRSSTASTWTPRSGRRSSRTRSPSRAASSSSWPVT